MSKDISSIKEKKTNDKEEKLDIPIMLSFFINLVVFTVPLYVSILLIYVFYLYVYQFISFFIIFFPVIIILAVAAYVSGVVILSSWITLYFVKKSKPVQGVFKRKFPASEIIQYYHYRGFVIKYPLWLASKTPIPGPWSIRWVLNKVGHNHIDKSVVMLDCFPALEFLTIKKDAILYPGSIISTHIVDSIFGNLTILENSLGNNTTFYPSSAIPPGAVINDNYVMMPNLYCRKNWHGKEGKLYYTGVPAKPTTKYTGPFSLLKSQSEDLYIKQGYLSGEDIDKFIIKKNE